MVWRHHRAVVLFVSFLAVQLLFGQEIEWTRVVDSAAWGGRTRHSSVVFDGKMWVLGVCRRTHHDRAISRRFWSGKELTSVISGSSAANC